MDMVFHCVNSLICLPIFSKKKKNKNELINLYFRFWEFGFQSAHIQILMRKNKNDLINLHFRFGEFFFNVHILKSLLKSLLENVFGSFEGF